jgi:hypothetical protein
MPSKTSPSKTPPGNTAPGKPLPGKPVAGKPAAGKPVPSAKSHLKIAHDTTRNPAAERGLTSERIANDVDAFRANGGMIEVLGITRVLSPTEHAQHTRELAEAKTAARKAGT